MAKSDDERQDTATRALLETLRQSKKDPTPYDIALRMTSEVLQERR